MFKRLKNNEDKNLTKLQAINDKGEQQLRELKNIGKSNKLKAIDEIRRKNQEADKILLDVKKIDTILYTAELFCTKTDGRKYDFNIFVLLLKFVEKTLNYEITLDEAIRDQNELEKLIFRLENYNEKNKKIEEKNKALKSAVKLFRVREDIIGFYRKGIFPFLGNVFKTKEEEKSEEKSEEKFINGGIIFIKEKSRDINNDFFKKYFDFVASIDLANKLYKTKDPKENSEIVEETKNTWSNLKDEIKEMSKEEIKNEKPNEIFGIANEIIDFNKEIQK